MKFATPIVLLAVAAVIAIGGYWSISVSCPGSLLSTAMTGVILVPGTLRLLPYRWLLTIVAYLVLRVIYLAARRDAKAPRHDPLPFAVVAVGIAVIGLLAINYGCPFAIGPWILYDDASIAGFQVAYAWILSVAAAVALYAAWLWLGRKPQAS